MARATRAQWQERVRRWQRSGLDATSFAAREGVNSQRLRWWRWKLGRGSGGRRGAAQPAFVEVVLPETAGQPVPTQAGAHIELVIGQRRVLVRPGFEAESLRRVLSVLEEG